jgi:nucleoid DNA-binding protein
MRGLSLSVLLVVFMTFVASSSAFFLPSTPSRSTLPTRSRSLQVLRASSNTDTMKKADFINAIVEKTGVTKATASTLLNAVIESITDSVVEGKKVTFSGFGTFEKANRKARTGRNPRTGDVIEIAAYSTLTFSISKALKDKLNGRD